MNDILNPNLNISEESFTCKTKNPANEKDKLKTGKDNKLYILKEVYIFRNREHIIAKIAKTYGVKNLKRYSPNCLITVSGNYL